MTTFKELSEVGEELGFKGTNLHDYIKAEQDRAREDRQKEQLDLEHKHKLELIAKGGAKSYRPMFTAYIKKNVLTLTSVFVCLFTVTLPGVCPILLTNAIITLQNTTIPN
jgi:hypothetical protein